MRLQLCTWSEIERYLQSSTTVIVPIGSTEQHGPNGLIGTDALTAEAIAHAVGEATATLVAPVINVGMAQHHLGFPGTITLRPSTLIACVRDYVNSLAVHGFDRFYFLNGHGGNVATLTASFSELYAERSLGTAASNRPALRLAVQNWWTGSEVKRCSRELFGESEGSHATPSEVAVTFHLFPQAVKSAPMSPRLAPVGYIRDALDYRASFPDGRIGSDPSLATPEKGRQIFEAAVKDTIADLQRFAAT